MLYLDQRLFGTASAQAADDGASRVLALSIARTTQTGHKALDAVKEGTKALDETRVTTEKRYVALLSRGSGDTGDEGGHDGGNGVGLHFVRRFVSRVGIKEGVFVFFFLVFERARC